MKKNLLIIGLLLAMSLGVSAQNTGFAFGLKLGPGFDWTGSTTGAAKSEGVRTGFGVGLVAEYYFAENYAIVTGVNVNMNRGHYSFQNAHLDSVAGVSPFSVDRYYKSTVSEIPLMLKMVTPEMGNIPLRAYAQLGAAFGITPVVKVKDEFELDELEPIEDKVYRVAKGEYNPIHASLRAGVGVEYAFLETTRAFLGVYYSYDILNGISSGVHGITNNYRKYYCGNKDLGERPNRLDIHQHRIGIELGVLF